MRSLVVLSLRPPLRDRGLWFGGHVHRRAVLLLEHAVATSVGGGLLDVRVELLDLTAGQADGDHHRSPASARSPEKVAVVPAYGRAERTPSRHKSHRASLPLSGGG